MSDMSIEEIERIATDLESHAGDCQHWIDRAEHYGKTPKIQLHEDGLRSSEAASAIRRLMNEQKWQPLDTAPLDGTLVDLWVRLKGGSFEKRVPECSWGWIRKWNGEEYQGWIGLGHMHEERIPLAWRLLPSPPETSDE